MPNPDSRYPGQSTREQERDERGYNGSAHCSYKLLGVKDCEIFVNTMLHCISDPGLLAHATDHLHTGGRRPETELVTHRDFKRNLIVLNHYT